MQRSSGVEAATPVQPQSQLASRSLSLGLRMMTTLSQPISFASCPLFRILRNLIPKDHEESSLVRNRQQSFYLCKDTQDHKCCHCDCGDWRRVLDLQYLCLHRL